MPCSLRPCLLFDFDGTLVDSGPVHDWAYRRTLNRYRPELLENFDYEGVKGKTTRDVLASLGVPGQALDLLTIDKQRNYRAGVAEGRLNLLPGARGLLDTLAGMGTLLFLVTSGSRDSVTPALRAVGIDHFFQGVVTADEAPAGKPAPAPYRFCLEQFRLRAGDCVAVEDAPSGAVSARAAGLPVIGVHDRATADWVDRFFPSLHDFREWVQTVVAGETAAL